MYIFSKQPLSEIKDGLNIIGEEGYVILDFDHTLWLGNSTELFLSSVCPRFYGVLLDKIAKKIWYSFHDRLPFELDQFRLLIISIFAPFTWLIWKNNTNKSIDIFWNDKLWDAVEKYDTRNIVIVSLGFKAVIDPILKAKFTILDDRPHLIASGLFGTLKSIRTIGKVESIERKYVDIQWDKTIAVSDSLEDKLLLMKSKIGVHTYWNEPELRPRFNYFPFRYLNNGKYPNGFYMKNYIIGQDLVVWLILLYSDLWSIIPALLLFISFQIIYEIGYYENDFIGSKNEVDPQLSSSYNEFSRYNIFYAWFYSLPLGILGCVLYSKSVDILSISIWIVVLILLRTVYHIYNKQKPDKRLKYYAYLQALKNFSGIVILIPNPVGIILAVSHMFQHTTVYYIYRCGGNKLIFPRSQMRTILFLIGLFILFVCHIRISIVVVCISIMWLLYQDLIELCTRNPEIVNKYKLLKLLSEISHFARKILSR